MQLLTNEIRKKLLENGQPENRDNDHPPVVKLFLPCTGFTWLLSELDPDNPDIAFGLCDLGMGFPELGSVLISELEDLSIGNDAIKVERDLHFEAEYPMSVYSFAANAVEMITEDKFSLNAAAGELKHVRGKVHHQP